MLNVTNFKKYEQSRKENKITDFTENGNCSKCGNCCSDSLVVTKAEIRTIRGYIKKHNIKEQKHFLPLQVNAVDFTCPFLNNQNKESKCTIYAVRPKICQLFSCNNMDNSNLYQIKNYSKLEKISMRRTFFEGE